MIGSGFIQRAVFLIAIGTGLNAFSRDACAQARVANGGEATVVVLRPLGIESSQALDFGWIVAGNEGGTLRIAPGGEVNCNGSLVCQGQPRPAVLRISGADETVRVALDPVAQLFGPAGESVRVTLIGSSESVQLTDGFGTVTVGGSIRFDKAPPPGTYHGLIHLDFVYQ